MVHAIIAVLYAPMSLLMATSVQSNVCLSTTQTTITQPANGSVIRNDVVDVYGTTMNDSALQLTDNGQAVAQAYSDSNGVYRVQLPLATGQHTLQLTAVNPCGATGSASTQFSVKTDTAPVTPTEPSTETPASTTPPRSSSTTSPNATAPTQQSTSNTATSDTTTNQAVINLKVSSPQDKTTVQSAQVYVSGTTERAATYTVTVNGNFAGSISLPSLTYGINVPLQIGTNTIVITAASGDETDQRTITVTREQQNDVDATTTMTSTMPWYFSLKTIITLVIMIMAVIVIIIVVRKSEIFYRR